MSSNIAKLDDIFEVLHEDHSYFLTYPTISRSQGNRKIKNRIEVTSFFHYNRDEKYVAAEKITRFFSSLRQRKIFQKLKYTIYSFMRENPALILKRIDPMYFSLYEKDKYTVVFRLAGETFPPHIVCKIFGQQYIIRSYNFPIREAQKGSNNLMKGNAKGSASNYPKKHSNWKICYVYKHDKTTKRSLKLNSYRKNTHLITWISEKYGR
ncbi:hypothetical protein WA026_000478 [Henosepilachna vigintioctopunctata]|uniref:Uncharacterized protein n=1 Tax=Henosepilachna vigintioctopunctata TaxID=420089 RepID=A0AAW1V3Z1_9CUCU